MVRNSTVCFKQIGSLSVDGGLEKAMTAEGLLGARGWRTPCIASVLLEDMKASKGLGRGKLLCSSMELSSAVDLLLITTGWLLRHIAFTVSNKVDMLGRAYEKLEICNTKKIVLELSISSQQK